MLRAALAQIETLIRNRASSAWCRAHWSLSPCGCWRCTALRIIKHAP